MTNEQRRLLALHTRLFVHMLYCYCMIETFPPDVWNRYECAKDTYLERERDYKQAVQP